MEKKICEYGCNQIGNFLLKTGKWCCCSTYQSCTSVREKNSKSTTNRLKSEYEQGKRTSYFSEYNKINTHNKKGWIPTENALESWKISSILGKGRIGIGLASTLNLEDERRKKISKSIVERYEKGWMPKSGRCKKIEYHSKIAGNVLVDGTWELKTAIYLDENKINWIRNTKKFRYQYQNKFHNYTPDFYLKDTKEYLEIKGYETELDRCKWSQFTEKLIIWKKNDLKKRNII